MHTTGDDFQQQYCQMLAALVKAQSHLSLGDQARLYKLEMRETPGLPALLPIIEIVKNKRPRLVVLNCGDGPVTTAGAGVIPDRYSDQLGGEGIDQINTPPLVTSIDLFLVGGRGEVRGAPQSRNFDGFFLDLPDYPKLAAAKLREVSTLVFLHFVLNDAEYDVVCNICCSDESFPPASLCN